METPVKTINAEKSKALQAALAQIEKQFGKGTIMRLGAGEGIEDIQVVSTGSLGLDVALGVGGLPRGRGKWWQRCKNSAACAPLWMLSMRWTSSTPRLWV